MIMTIVFNHVDDADADDNKEEMNQSISTHQQI